MTAIDHLQHPSRCFCQIPLQELKVWFERHYVQGIPTVELLESAATAREREVISIVALFELDDLVVLKLMGGVNLPEHHILHCREYFRAKLSECLAK